LSTENENARRPQTSRRLDNVVAGGCYDTVCVLPVPLILLGAAGVPSGVAEIEEAEVGLLFPQCLREDAQR